MLLGWCIQSHHERALPRLYPRYDRASEHKRVLEEILGKASGGRIRLKGRAARARLSHPVFLEEALLRIARAQFKHLDADTIDAARA